jgi:hypothetical protein
MRTDGGKRHPVSGVWHQNSVTNIGRNALFAGLQVAGRRSMGDQSRFTPTGPRPLNALDQQNNGKPKVIQNSPENRIVAKAHFPAITEQAEYDRLNAILDERAGSQRGKPRSRTPDKNPSLGVRIFDSCGWPMYRTSRGKSFEYRCGLYMQSHGECCEHNHVDGVTAIRVGLRVLQRRLGSPEQLQKVMNRLGELARIDPTMSSQHRAQHAMLEAMDVEMATIGQNLARAKTDEQYLMIENELDKLKLRQASLRAELMRSESTNHQEHGEDLMKAAASVLNQLPDLVSDESNLGAIGRAFRAVNLRMFLSFEKRQIGNRFLSKVREGVITLGDAPQPFALYAGPTGRRALSSDNAATLAARSGPTEQVGIPDRYNSGWKGDSLGNVNRGDRI